MKMVYNEQLNDHICKAQPIEWAVVNVKANDDYTIDITFINGEKRVFDVSKLLNKKIYDLCADRFFFLRHMSAEIQSYGMTILT